MKVAAFLGLFCAVSPALGVNLGVRGSGDDDADADADSDIFGNVARDLPPVDTAAASADAAKHDAAVADAAKAAQAAWNYDARDRRRGPWAWAGVDADFARCGRGADGTQSPIDISEVRDAARHLPPVRTEWITAQDTSLINGGNGAMTVALFQGKGQKKNLISWRGRDYEVKDVRFHSPSEHSVRGTKFPLEAQIGTLGENGRRLFLSVMFTEGEKSAVLGKFWGKFPTTRDVVSVGKGSLNVKDIVPDKGQYYLYRGSDSRPPCDPATWIVFKDPLEVSEEQVRDFVLRAGEPTSRPIQPSGDRTVRISAPTPETEDLLPKGTLTIKPVEAPVVAK